MRTLHVLNGLTDMSFAPDGILGDPTANYTSYAILEEMVEFLAQSLRERQGARMRKSAAFGFMADESTDEAGNAVLLLYLRWLDEDMVILLYYLLSRHVLGTGCGDISRKCSLVDGGW